MQKKEGLLLLMLMGLMNACGERRIDEFVLTRPFDLEKEVISRQDIDCPRGSCPGGDRPLDLRERKGWQPSLL